MIDDVSRRPLRVAVIGPSRFPVAEPFAGGLESFVDGLVVGLRARGHAVTLFAGAASPGAHPDHPLDRGGWTASELAREDVSMPGRTFLADHHQHLGLMLALAGDLGDEFDVVHNHSLHHLPVAMAGAVRAPVITTLHTPPTAWLESAVELGGEGVAAWTAVSRATAAQWTGLRGRIQVVRNGVDASAWPAGPGGDGLVWSGRLVPEKAPHLAVDAARAAGRTLVLAGPVGDPGYVREVLVPRLGPDAELAGHLSRPELARLVGGSAAALVTPVWDEPFGLVAAEAGACGTPVVAFRRGGLSEVVLPSSGVLVPPDDVRAMAAAVPVATALDRREVRRSVLSGLSVRSVLADYEALYRDVIARRHRHHPLQAATPA